MMDASLTYIVISSLPHQNYPTNVVLSRKLLVTIFGLSLRLHVFYLSRGSWGVAGSEKFFTSPNQGEDGGGVSIKNRNMNLPGG